MNLRMINPLALQVWLTLACLALLGPGVSVAAPAPEPTPEINLPPLPESPIAMFRAWLNLDENDRARALVDKPESARRILLAKLTEYDAMDPAQRELRLRATELQYHLRPLLQAPLAERPDRLTRVPREFRPLLADRLAKWDVLDPAIREELLDNGWAIRYFVRLESGTTAEQDAVRRQLPPQRRAQFETELARWESLPLDQRRNITHNFQQFFELPPADQQRALDNLPESERRQIEATLEAFSRLPPAQRQLCLNSFRKFAGLTADQRAGFLRNADRWKEMSAEDRATWRRLVTQLPPFPPSGALLPMPPFPNPDSQPLPPPPTNSANNPP
jgi:hypothetical protein